MPCKREKYIEVMGEKEKFEIVDLCEKLLLSLAYASYDVFATLPKILDVVLSISLGNGTIIKTNFEVDQPMWIDYGMQILLGRDRLGEMVEKRSEILTKTLILNQLPFIKSKITKKMLIELLETLRKEGHLKMKLVSGLIQIFKPLIERIASELDTLELGYTGEGFVSIVLERLIIFFEKIIDKKLSEKLMDIIETINANPETMIGLGEDQSSRSVLDLAIKCEANQLQNQLIIDVSSFFRKVSLKIEAKIKHWIFMTTSIGPVVTLTADTQEQQH